jgi:3-methyladenine DNA glycosylase AlkD
MTVGLVEQIRIALRAQADPVRAPQMQRYMKSAMPYLGVPMPRVRAITKASARDRESYGGDALIAAATTLWRDAQFREEHYAATELTADRRVRGDLAVLDLLTEMIVSGAWWDHVDAVAHGIGALLLAHRDVLTPRIRDWSTKPDRWLRRASIICQLGHRDRTDTDLLAETIEVNTTDREFFVRKAIGWALRDYARTDPDWVRRFVESHELSPLSRREAMKHLSG